MNENLNESKQIIKKPSKNLLPLSFLVAGLILGSVFVYYTKRCPQVSKILSAQNAAEKAIAYINENLLQDEFTASLVEVFDANGVYKFKLKVGDQEFDSYVTKDGEILFASGIEMEEESSDSSGQEPVSKRDIPDVKLFVMSYCPFGLQAEKALLPAWRLLKDKADIGIYFVDYIMHEKKEIDENLRQYCIQKQEPEKIISYLECFVIDGDSEKCRIEVDIDKAKLSACESSTDQEFKITENYNDKNSWINGTFPEFLIHADLNEKYGVSGSPTLVINDTVVSPNQRSPEAFKKAICDSFIEPPQECSQTLSEENTSSGFGQGSSDSSGGSCE